MIDSLLLTADSTSAWRTVGIEQLFGATTEQASLPNPVQMPFEPATTSSYGVLVVALLILYLLLLYRHAGDVGRLLGRALQDRTGEDRLYDDTAGSFSRFLSLANLLGLLALAVAVVRLTGAMIPLRHTELMPHMAALLWSAILVAALGLVRLYRKGVAAVIAAITFTKHHLEQLTLVHRTGFALLTIIALPPMLLWLLTPPDGGRLWVWLLVLESAVSLILYLHETYTLFISKKISILHWILYLCTVEIFPLSLLILLAGRCL